MSTPENSLKQILDNYFIKESIPSSDNVQPSLLQINQNQSVDQYQTLMRTYLQNPSEVNNEDALTDLLSTTILIKKASLFLELLIQLKHNDMIKKLFTQIEIQNEESINEDYEDALFILRDYLVDDSSLVFDYLDNAVKSHIVQLYPVFSLILQHYTHHQSNPSEITSLIEKMISKGIEFSTCAVNSVIDYYCRINELESSQSFLNKMTDYKPSKLCNLNGLKLKKYQFGFGVNIVTYGTFIKWLCKKNHMDLAMYYYQFLKEKDMLKDEIIYNLLIDGYAKAGDIESLKQLYFDMLNNSIKPTIITFNTIIDAYIRTKDVQSAWSIYDDLIKNNIQPDNFTLANLFKGIRLPCHKEYFDKAISIVKSFNYKGTDIILINVLLDACIAMKESKLLIELFQDVINERMPNVLPDIITYNTFIKGCAQMGLRDQVIFAYDSLCSNSLKFNVYPNDVTFNTLIDVYVRCGDMKQVWAIIAKMKSLNIKPDNFTYSTIIKSLNKNSNLNLISNDNNNSNNGNDNYNTEDSENELDLAFKLFDNVKKNHKPDEILYNCIMDACLRFNQIDKMLELYDNMLTEGVQPSSITCGIVIKAYGMKGNLNKALEMYEQMKEQCIEISSITYGGLINACIQNNNLQKAFYLFEELQRTGYEMTTVLSTTLIKAYAKSRNLPKVLEIFSTMKLSTSNPPNKVTYNSVIDCCIKGDDYIKANEIFEEMCIRDTKEEQPDIITFSTLIKGVLKKGEFDSAMKYYNIMKQRNVKPDEVLLNSLLDGCDKCHQYSKGIELFESVKSFGVEPTMMSYSIMMKLLGKLNDFPYSKKLLDEIIKKNKNVSVIMLTCFIRTALNSKEIRTVIETFNLFDKFHLVPDAIAYNTIINGVTTSNYDKGLCGDLCKIISKSIDSNIILQRYSYIGVLRYLKGCKMYDKANEMGLYFEKNNRLEPRKFNNNNHHYNTNHMQNNQNNTINTKSTTNTTVTKMNQDRKPLAQVNDYSKKCNDETGNHYEQSIRHDENSSNMIYSFNNDTSTITKVNTQQSQSQLQKLQQQENYLKQNKKIPQKAFHVYNNFDNTENENNTTNTPFTTTLHQLTHSLTDKHHNKDKPTKKFNRF